MHHGVIQIHAGEQPSLIQCKDTYSLLLVKVKSKILVPLLLISTVKMQKNPAYEIPSEINRAVKNENTSTVTRRNSPPKRSIVSIIFSTLALSITLICVILMSIACLVLILKTNHPSSNEFQDQQEKTRGKPTLYIL